MRFLPTGDGHAVVSAVWPPRLPLPPRRLGSKECRMLEDNPTCGSTHQDRLASLRAELKRRRLDGFIVPRQDEFQGEYVAPYAERLRWLTGFAGSWGMAIVLADRAAIFVDGRYTLQVREQVDTALFTPHHLIDEPPPEWMEKNLGQRSGAGLRSLAPDRRPGGRVSRRPAPRPARRSKPSTAIPSTPSGTTARPPGGPDRRSADPVRRPHARREARRRR